MARNNGDEEQNKMSSLYQICNFNTEIGSVNSKTKKENNTMKITNDFTQTNTNKGTFLIFILKK